MSSQGRKILRGSTKLIVVAAAVLCLSAFVIILYAQGRGPGEGPQVAWMPTHGIGDEWVYMITGKVKYTCRLRIVGEEVLNGDNTYLLKLSFDPPYQGYSSEMEVWVERETGDTLRTTTSARYWGEPHRWVTDYKYEYPEGEKWPLQVGKEYTKIQKKIGIENITLQVKVESWEEISVPAGKFLCFKIVYYDENGRAWRREWYSDSVEQNIRWIDGETGETWELTSYSVEEGSLAIYGPTELEVGEEAVFTVTSEGSPVLGAAVEADDSVVASDENGMVTFVFSEPGEFKVTASKEGYEGASIPVKVETPLEGAPYHEVVGVVNSVEDGDTIEVGILKLTAKLDPAGDVSPGTIEGVRFGGGIDAPERYENGGSESTTFIEELIPPGTVVYLDLDNLARGGGGNPKYMSCPYRGHYGRLIAVIYTMIEDKWVNVNAELTRWGMKIFPDHKWDEFTWITSEFNMYEWPPYDNDYPYVL